MSKFELLKKLESLIAFQSGCLQEGDWEDFDKAENTVRELEKKILDIDHSTGA
jgi:hypothetical protein